ncbi:MAG: IS21 family transposase, partial [Myxococcota bacterium]
MRKIREILRLRWEARLSRRQVAQSCHVSPSTVAEIEYRANVASLSWPLSVTDDAELERLLYPPQSESGKAIPEWTVVHRELKKPGVTLQLLWHEYRKNHPEGLGYSQFCNRFRTWKKTLDVSMRINHKAGEKTFIDFAGQTVDIIDSNTGEVRQAHVFVAALGASNYTFARATLELDKRA